MRLFILRHLFRDVGPAGCTAESLQKTTLHRKNDGAFSVSKEAIKIQQNPLLPALSHEMYL